MVFLLPDESRKLWNYSTAAETQRQPPVGQRPSSKIKIMNIVRLNKLLIMDSFEDGYHIKRNTFPLSALLHLGSFTSITLSSINTYHAIFLPTHPMIKSPGCPTSTYILVRYINQLKGDIFNHYHLP